MQKGWEPPSSEKKSSVVTRVTAAEITNLINQIKQAETSAVSSPAIESDDDLVVVANGCQGIEFHKIGPAAFDQWLKPELLALGATVTYNADDNSGGALVPEENIEAAKQVILSWCDLENE